MSLSSVEHAGVAPRPPWKGWFSLGIGLACAALVSGGFVAGEYRVGGQDVRLAAGMEADGARLASEVLFSQAITGAVWVAKYAAAGGGQQGKKDPAQLVRQAFTDALGDGSGYRLVTPARDLKVDVTRDTLGDGYVVMLGGLSPTACRLAVQSVYGRVPSVSVDGVMLANIRATPELGSSCSVSMSHVVGLLVPDRPLPFPY